MNAHLDVARTTPLRVLVADDSTLMRKMLCAIVRQAPALELAGEACDGLDALEKAEALAPDVILLDIEMPRLDGLGFLARARLRTAASVIVVSSLAEPGSPAFGAALALGAADIVAKPSGVLSLDMAARRREALLAAIRRCPALRPAAAATAAPDAPGASLADRLWPDFVLEATLQLDAIDAALAAPAAADGRQLYRNFHTLKGSCALMGFTHLQAVALAAEDLLRPVRDGERALQGTLVPALAAAADWLRGRLAAMAGDHADNEPAPQLLAALRALH